MFVRAYEYLNKIHINNLQKVLHLFNETASAVCEGQQLDMDFENRETVGFDEYVNMITLKTSVLLAASLQLGAILGGAGEGNQRHLYGFGKNLGIAFQVQDDYLDVFGNPEKFGKQVGGDILSNKKTFLLIHAMETASAEEQLALKQLLLGNAADKVEKVTAIFKNCKADNWAQELKNKYLQTALQHLEDTNVVSARKKPLMELAAYLIQREN